MMLSRGVLLYAITLIQDGLDLRIEDDRIVFAKHLQIFTKEAGWSVNDRRDLATSTLALCDLIVVISNQK